MARITREKRSIGLGKLSLYDLLIVAKRKGIFIPESERDNYSYVLESILDLEDSKEVASCLVEIV